MNETNPPPTAPVPPDDAMRHLAQQMFAMAPPPPYANNAEAFFFETGTRLLIWAKEYQRMRITLDELVSETAEEAALVRAMPRAGRLRVINGDKTRTPFASGGA